MRETDNLEQARTAYADWAWRRAFDAFAAAEREREPEPPDLEMVAISAHLLGRFPDYSRSVSGPTAVSWLPMTPRERPSRPRGSASSAW